MVNGRNVALLVTIATRGIKSCVLRKGGKSTEHTIENEIFHLTSLVKTD